MWSSLNEIIFKNSLLIDIDKLDILEKIDVVIFIIYF